MFVVYDCEVFFIKIVYVVIRQWIVFLVDYDVISQFFFIGIQFFGVVVQICVELVVMFFV